MRVEGTGEGDLGITVLYLLYPRGPGYRRERPIGALRRILSRLSSRTTVVYIDNSDANDGPREVGSGEYAIGGDNTYLEFSGWQRGLAFARQLDVSGDVFLFANDTLLAQSRYHRWLLNQAAVDCSSRYRSMVGRRVALPVSGEIFGNPLIPYVRTHLFLLPRAVLDELGSVVSLDADSIDRIVLPTFDPAVHLFQPDAPVSKSIRDYVLFHLHSSWHRRVPYSAEHFETLRGKTISILNSILLSMRVHELGYPLVSLAKTSRLLRLDPAPDRLQREWLDGRDPFRPVSENAVTNPFWETGANAYRRIPERARTFSLENVLDFVERRKHPEHL